MRAGLLLLLACCVDQPNPPPAKKYDATFVDSHLLREVPPRLQRFDVQLGDGELTYLGATIDQEIVAPGGTVHVHYFWKVNKPVRGEWRMFAIVRGAAGQADFMNLPATDMELWHPVSTWKVGEIIDDPQDFTLRPDWRSRTASFQVGLIQSDAHTPNERMVASGAHTLDRAIVVRDFQVDLAKAPPPPDTIYVRRAQGAIVVDGLANDLGWAGTTLSPEFAQADGCGESQGKAQAKLTWDDQNLYVFVTVTDPDITSPYTKHDESLWKADDIEIFIDADANRRTYVELQVNPNNATFDSYFANRQTPDPSWDSHMVTAVQKKTVHQAAGDLVTGWDAEIAIPWEDVRGRDTAPLELPPKVGNKWRLNVVRVDARSGSKDAWASSWNRISCTDWHALDRMLTAVFADSSGGITQVISAPPLVPALPVTAGSGSGK